MKLLSLFFVAASGLLFNETIAQNKSTGAGENPMEEVLTDAQTKAKYIQVGERKYLAPEYANDYIIRYQKRKQRKVNKKAVFFGGHRDSKSIYFDLAKLETIIKQGKEASTTFCGLRFYYGKYPRNHTYTDTIKNSCKVEPSKETWNIGLSHTLLIVPVEKNKDGEIADIRILGKDGKYYVLVFGVLVENQGVLCPPMPPSYCKAQYLGIEK